MPELFEEPADEEYELVRLPSSGAGEAIALASGLASVAIVILAAALS